MESHYLKTIFLSILFITGIVITVPAQDDDLYSFDIEAFEKKIWEWKGAVTLTAVNKSYNQNSVIYPIKITDERTDSQSFETSLEIESRWDWEWLRLFLSGKASGLQSTTTENNDQDAVLREAYWQFALFDPHNIEIGKRVLRWGKGYAFNPVALIERVKNPEDPEASREGLWIAQGVFFTGSLLGFETTSLNLIYLPIGDDVNYDYKEDIPEEEMWGLKLYGLTGTTDINLYGVLWTKNDITQWGVDFASNLKENLAIHGEYAATQTEENHNHEALVGLRYLTESDITWIVEFFHDSNGMDSDESEDNYKQIESGSPVVAKTYIAQLQQNKTISQNYGYLKASVKEPFDWLYFTPSVTCLNNMDDGSSNYMTQLAYAPSENWSLAFTWQHLDGDQFSQYGENLTRDKIELELVSNF